MAQYVATYLHKFNEATQQLEFVGFDVFQRIGDPDCLFTNIDTLPPWYKGLEADFDEPVTAVSWSASKGLYVKPEPTRGYELTRISWYPQLAAYLTQVNPVMAELLKAITTQYPIQPNEECYNNIKVALDEALAAREGTETT